MRNKVITKICCFAVTCAILLSISITAFAAGGEDKISWTNPKLKNVYISHQTLEKKVADESVHNGVASFLFGAVTAPFVSPVGGIVIAAATGILPFVTKSEAQRWLDISKDHGYSGVIATYKLVHEYGGYYAGGGSLTKDRDIWIFDGIKAQ